MQHSLWPLSLGEEQTVRWPHVSAGHIPLVLWAFGAKKKSFHPGYGTLGTLLHLSESPFLHFKNGGNSNTGSVDLLRVSNDSLCFKCKIFI